jgi:rubrerythrin
MSPVEKAVLDGLSKGIQAELAAYVFYKKGLALTKDEKLRATLTDLAAQEKEHFLILEGQYDSLVRSEMWNTISDVLRRKGLPDIEEKMESVHEDLIDEVSESTTPLRMLEIALILEERAVNMYADMAKKVKDIKGKEMYEYLAKFETGHAKLIKKMMESYK